MLGGIIANLSTLSPGIRANAEWLVSYAKRHGVKVTVTSVRRSRAKQQQLYENWKAGLSKWPANPPGQSAHEYGLAWDSVVAPEYQWWWNLLREWAGWQVPKNDEIHAQVPDWREWVSSR